VCQIHIVRKHTHTHTHTHIRLNALPGPLKCSAMINDLNFEQHSSRFSEEDRSRTAWKRSV